MRSAEREVLAAAAVIRECRNRLAECGGTILGEAIAGAEVPSAWRHYPSGEVYDPESHAQFFFHRHDPVKQTGRELRGEAGHFHLFLRAEGMPSGTSPLLLPELAVANAPLPPQAAPLKRGGRDEVSHLVAIGIDWAGEPVRLFTTNRWVTGETWYGAADVIRMLDRFKVAAADPSPVLNRWITAVVRLFRPEITVLLRQRDDTVMAWRSRRRSNGFEDPRLEITSSFDIDLEARLANADRLAVEPARAAMAPARRSIPRLAEGWGV